jgi:hypothetical protein
VTVADYVVKQGDVLPYFTDTLTYIDGSAVDLTGATVRFVMRSLTGAQPITNAVATITNAPAGQVLYQPTTTDTATPDQYMGNWLVYFPGFTAPQTWPTDGYLWIEVEENILTVGGATIVGLPDVKDYLNIPAGDRSHDAKLLRRINAAIPVVENIVGAVLPTQWDEWYDGGQTAIRLRHRPVMTLQAVTEYRGPIAYPLTIIADPSHGSTYSCQLDTASRVVRRTAGGGVIAFPFMPQGVHIVYTAGRSPVPPNIVEGMLELLRVNYQQTQQRSPRMSGAGQADDDLEQKGPPTFFVPNRVKELLSPTKRAPSVA